MTTLLRLTFAGCVLALVLCACWLAVEVAGLWAATTGAVMKQYLLGVW